MEFFSLSLTAQWGRGEKTEFPGKQTPETSREELIWFKCLFTGTYAHIIQSAKVISSYWPMSPNDTQPMLCEGVQGVRMCRLCVCRPRAGNRQRPELWHQIRASPVSWDSTISHLVFQRLRSAQTATGDVGATHIPCLLVTSSKQ